MVFVSRLQRIFGQWKIRGIRSVEPLRTRPASVLRCFRYVRRSLLTPCNPYLLISCNVCVRSPASVASFQVTPSAERTAPPECQLLPQLQQAHGRDSRGQGDTPARNLGLSEWHPYGAQGERAGHLIGSWDCLQTRNGSERLIVHRTVCRTRS